MAAQPVPIQPAGLDRDGEAAAIVVVVAKLVVVPQSQLARSPHRGRARADESQRAAAHLADQAVGGRVRVEEGGRGAGGGPVAVGAEVTASRGWIFGLAGGRSGCGDDGYLARSQVDAGVDTGHARLGGGDPGGNVPFDGLAEQVVQSGTVLSGVGGA